MSNVIPNNSKLDIVQSLKSSVNELSHPHSHNNVLRTYYVQQSLSTKNTSWGFGEGACSWPLLGPSR